MPLLRRYARGSNLSPESTIVVKVDQGFGKRVSVGVAHSYREQAGNGKIRAKAHPCKAGQEIRQGQGGAESRTRGEGRRIGVTRWPRKNKRKLQNPTSREAVPEVQFKDGRPCRQVCMRRVRLHGVQAKEIRVEAYTEESRDQKGLSAR